MIGPIGAGAIAYVLGVVAIYAFCSVRRINPPSGTAVGTLCLVAAVLTGGVTEAMHAAACLP